MTPFLNTAESIHSLKHLLGRGARHGVEPSARAVQPARRDHAHANACNPVTNTYTQVLELTYEVPRKRELSS